MSPKDCAYIVERLAIRFMAMVADHERQLSEHRTSFGARTEADAKIIAGLRAEIDSLKREELATNETLKPLVDRVVKERDGLLTQVQDMRAEMERLKLACSTYAADWATAGNACRMRDNEYPLGAVIRLVRDDAERAEVAKRLVAERDALRAEVAALKSQTPNQHGRWVRATSEKCTHAKAGEVVSVRGYLVRTNSGEFLWEGKDCEPCDPPQTAPVPKRAHPVAVGGHLRRLTGFNTTPAGEVARVTLVDDDDPSQLEYEVVRPNGQKGRWSAKGCEPCDPPEATHDTEVGKAAAEAALTTEPVADEIKVGDLGEVFQATTRTLNSDVGITGCVSSIHLDPCHGGFLVKFDPSTQSRRSAGMQAFGLCDVRKVTT